jgi:HD-like signal output (HDOD) protein
VARPELDAEERALENSIIAHFDGHDLSLPPLPQSPERVLRALRNANLNLFQVAHEIGEDQVTAAAVLRLANSPLYRGMDRMTALEPAVVRLGGKALRTLMMHLTLRSVTAQETRNGHRWAEALSARALASGLIMRSLSRFTRVDPEEAFLIGLLHDIGAVVVLRIANRHTHVNRSLVREEVFEYLCHESHQEFGELLADAWELPPRIKSLVANHHSPVDADDPLRRERLQLQLADMLVGLLGFAPTAPYDILRSAAAMEFDLPARAEFFRFLEKLPAELDEAMECLG